MNAPSGTFLAQVRDGGVQFPPALHSWCEHSGWSLFRVEADTPDRLSLHPIPKHPAASGASDAFGDGYESSFDPQGRLWIPSDLRALVSLREQTVMIRLEATVIRVYLRKVFETLGFGP